MDDRVDPRLPPTLERASVRDLSGGAFRRIPLLPLVALVTFFFGLLVGYGVAPAPALEPTGAPAPALDPTLAPTSAPNPTASQPSFSYRVVSTPAPPPASPSATVAVTPPSGGITLARAIAVVKTRFSLTDSQILGVVLVDDRGVYSDKPPDRWTWEVLVAAKVGSCSVELPDGTPAPSDTCFGSISLVGVDYYTGQILP